MDTCLHNAHVRLYYRWNHFWAEEEHRLMAMLYWWHRDNQEAHSERMVDNGGSGRRKANQPVCTISR